MATHIPYVWGKPNRRVFYNALRRACSITWTSYVPFFAQTRWFTLCKNNKPVLVRLYTGRRQEMNCLTDMHVVVIFLWQIDQALVR